MGTGVVEGARYSYRDVSAEVAAAVTEIEQRVRSYGLDLPTVALAFSLACPEIDVSVVGPTTIDELHADVAALQVARTFDSFDEIISPVEYPNDWF